MSSKPWYRIVSFALAALLLFASFVSSPLAPQAKAEAASFEPPHILITEIVPDSADVTDNNATNDGYEYIEIFNNTDRAIDFKDYKLIYRYPTGEQDDVIWTPEPDNAVIGPGKTLLFWLRNVSNEKLTLADFNAHFGTELQENEVVRIDAGMHASRTRWIAVATNAGQAIAVAAYNDGQDDAESDMGVVYRYPRDGSNRMVKLSSRTIPATPGSVTPDQIPAALVHVPEDASAPVIRNMSQAEARPASDIELAAEATDDSGVKTLSVFYRTDKQADFARANLKYGREDGLFRHSIAGVQLLGSSYVEYYFIASDGTNETTSERFRTDIAAERSSPRLQATGDRPAGGTIFLKAAADDMTPEQLRLSIDGEVAASAVRGMEFPAYLALEVNGADRSHKNVIKTGDIVWHWLDYGVTGFNTVYIPIDGIAAGGNTVTITAGSQSGPYDGISKENLDDFDIRNVRLLLADGTELRDPRYADPSQTFDMGDNGRFLPTMDFTFTVPEDRANALIYRWDTASAVDGEHRVAVVAPDGRSAETTVPVDNHGPDIRTTLEEGKSYKGAFIIDVEAEDAVSGVQSVAAKLDGRAVELPYRTSSGELSPGEHTLAVTAIDQSGRRSAMDVRFATADEHPGAPLALTPADGSGNAGTSPTLTVKVTDPTGDPMDVSFYRGYAAQASELKLLRGASDTEPPQSLSIEGESPLTADEIADASASDDRYVTVDSTTQFPYIRMEVELEQDYAPEDTVELVWEGHSLPGRKVTLYAWNYASGKWMPLDSRVAATEADFTLKGKVQAEHYVKDRKAQLIVQDQVEQLQHEPFTFVWMSDTQYYTQTFSNILESQVHWIRDQAEDLNIRYVFHTGDIVENAHQVYQWDNADRLMKVLEDADIPYGVLAGNHDVLPGNDYAMYSKYFGASRFDSKPYYGESYRDNRGHYDLISAGGIDFILLYMGWGEGEEEIAWMNKVLAEHPDRKAIVSFHDYVNASGQRSATGQKLFSEVVKPNPNVFMVLSGHYTGAALITDKLDDNGDGTPDRTVYQMLSDYQGLGDGGDGYMKLLRFDPASGTIEVKTYSPHKDDYNYYDPIQYPNKDEFSLSADLTPQLKRVATDYVQANVYTNRPIGLTQKAASGETAEVQWTGLRPNQKYFWFVEVADGFGGRTVSELWSFATGAAVLPSPALRAEEVTDTEARIAWEPVAADSERTVTYDVYMNGAAAASVTDAAYRTTGLAPDTEYRFTVVAVDEQGVRSEPSEELVVRTLANLADIKQAVESWIAGGELEKPLAAQVTSALRQAEHQSDKGDRSKAVKHLRDLLKHASNPAMQERITNEARETLVRKVNALIDLWSR